MEFDDKVIAIIRKQDKTVSAANQTFFDSLPATEQRIFAALSKHVQKFSSDGERFVFDDGNVLLTNQVEKIILEAIQGSTYPKDVNGFLRNFETIKEFSFEIHRDINDVTNSEFRKIIDPVQRNIVEETLTGLTGAGMSTNFMAPIRTGIFQNIVAGSTKADLEAYLRRYILGTPEVDGTLSRYVKQVSRDALNQFDGQVNAKIANEFGLDAYRYVGSLIEDSRPQCRRWVAMGVIQTKDLPDEIAWMNANGTGAIPGTSPETFSIYRGGYNCRHSAIPFKLTKSQREKLNLTEEKQQIEKSVERASAEIGTPRAAKDIKNLYSYISKKTPQELVGLPGLPEILFEYSDNGRVFLTNGDSFYVPNPGKAGFVQLGFSNKRYEDNKAGKLKVAIHEFAHRTHTERKKIFENKVDGRIQSIDMDPGTEKYWKKSVKAFDEKIEEFKNSEKSAEPLFLIAKYKKKFPQYTIDELAEFAGSYSDTIMAVSKTQFGSGHSYPYMRDYDGGRSKMEWFAHSFENYFQGNPIFQSEFPELYEIMNDYVYEEIVLPYTPKDLLN